MLEFHWLCQHSGRRNENRAHLISLLDVSLPRVCARGKIRMACETMRSYHLPVSETSLWLYSKILSSHSSTPLFMLRMRPGFWLVHKRSQVHGWRPYQFPPWGSISAIMSRGLLSAYIWVSPLVLNTFVAVF